MPTIGLSDDERNATEGRVRLLSGPSGAAGLPNIISPSQVCAEAARALVVALDVDLIVNLKTARAIGLTISQSLLVRADQVIE